VLRTGDSRQSTAFLYAAVASASQELFSLKMMTPPHPDIHSQKGKTAMNGGTLRTLTFVVFLTILLSATSV